MLPPWGRRFELAPSLGHSTELFDDLNNAAQVADRVSTAIKTWQSRTRQQQVDEALTLAHEQVHSAFCPKVALLREFRADLRIAGYKGSAFLKYTEEALAETIANIRVKGFSIPAVVEGLKFPVTQGYVTFGRFAKETAIGTIVYAGIVYAVYLETSPSEHNDQKGGRP